MSGRLADLEDRGAAGWTGALGRRLAVLHGDRLGVLDVALRLALEAVARNRHTPSPHRDGVMRGGPRRHKSAAFYARPPLRGGNSARIRAELGGRAPGRSLTDRSDAEPAPCR